MPGLSVAEPDLHAGTLLGIIIACSQLCQLRIVLQICPESKIIVGGITQYLTIALFFIQNAIILLIQNPAASLNDLEVIVLQNQLCGEILIQVNAAADRCIIFLFCLQNIVALLHILQFKITVAVDSQRLFALGPNIAQQQTCHAVLTDIVQHNLSTKSLCALGNSLCLGRYLRTVFRSVDRQRNASVLIKGYIPDLLLVVEHHGSKRIPLIRLNGDGCIHTGDHTCRTGNSIMLPLLQNQRYTSHDALTVETEMPAHVGK